MNSLLSCLFRISKFGLRISALLVASLSFAADSPKPIRALMVCGGCCHDYTNQKRILSEGISARANVEWTIVHEEAPQGQNERLHRISIYEKPEWWKGYDVVVHNECFGAIEDAAFVDGIAAAHQAGVAGVFLHCSSHSYRTAKTDEWRKVIGITSTSHEKNRDMLVKNLKPEHPVMKGFPAEWLNPKDELYKNDKVWDSAVPLAQAYGEETKKDHFVIWVNQLEKGKTFSTTMGHNNATMESPVYLDLVTRGLLWTTDRLNDDGTPKPGSGPVAK